MYKDFSENKLALLFMLCGYALLGALAVVCATAAVYVVGAMLMIVFSIFTPVDFTMTKIMLTGMMFVILFTLSKR